MSFAPFFAGTGFEEFFGGTTPPPPAYDLQPGDVRSGVTYVDSLGVTQTGSLRLPAANRVLLGTGYGENGTEHVGTLTVPEAAKVLAGVVYGAGGTQFVGNLELPDEDQVLIDVGYGDNATEFVGSMVANVGGYEDTKLNSVLPNGNLKSPLWIGTAYLTAYGNGFGFRVPAPSGVTPAEATVHFRGRLECSISDDYAWSVEDESVTEIVISGKTYWDITFSLPSELTATFKEGDYRWWIVAETLEDDLVLHQYKSPVKWLRG